MFDLIYRLIYFGILFKQQIYVWPIHMYVYNFSINIDEFVTYQWLDLFLWFTFEVDVYTSKGVNLVAYIIGRVHVYIKGWIEIMYLC